MIDKESGANVPLTAAGRLHIIQTLNALPRPQFDELVFALNPPKGSIPEYSVSQSNRSVALLEWAESPIGPGLHALDKVLSKMVSTSSKPETITFAITGKIEENLTVEELQAIVKLLRSKTGDSSIEISFITDG